MISVQSVSKSFGRQVVLNNVSLEILPGKTTAIVGPSGVGKSVLLKLILGIMTADKGKIEVCGRCITEAHSEAERNDIRSKVGVLFQSAALFDSLSIYQNIAFPLQQRTNLSVREIHEKVSFLLESLSLVPYANMLPDEVSLGTRKRVGLARALIMEPEVFLFDEPNTGLDPEVGQEVYDLISECKEKWGFTGVVISHELPEVFQVSDRVAMIFEGRIIKEGTPDEFRNSEHPAVQQFLYGKTDGPIQIQW